MYIPRFSLTQPHTWIVWLLIIVAVVWGFKNPGAAAHDVRAIAHWIAWGFGQVFAFIGAASSSGSK